MAADSRTHLFTLRRGIAVALVLLPILLVSTVQLVAVPDLQTWLQNVAKGYAHPDAFDHLSQIALPFTLLLAITTLIAVLLILFRKSNDLLLLSVGPCLGLLAYLSAYGIYDPAWFTFFALLTVGMLVGSPVTILWTAFRAFRRPQTQSA